MKKMLMIDNDCVSCEQAQHALENEYEITIASSVWTAPELLNTASFDLILLDLCLPGINGIDFLKEFVKKDEHPPVILTSSDNAVETEINGLDAGASDFIHKPYSSAVLKARVDRIIAHADLMKNLS
ncbi:MAG TPA: response regulator [Methanocorpusculum sp.]|nr:response regulator [Methanocorpusculum sp.]